MNTMTEMNLEKTKRGVLESRFSLLFMILFVVTVVNCWGVFFPLGPHYLWSLVLERKLYNWFNGLDVMLCQCCNSGGF